MRKRFGFGWIAAAAAAAACSGSPATAPDDGLSCERAAEILASCTDSSPADRCGDGAPAAETLMSGECSAMGGKADGLSIVDRGPGEACRWRWQCDFDRGLSCRDGTCGHLDSRTRCAQPSASYAQARAEQKLDVLYGMHQRSQTVPLDAFGDAAFALERVLNFLVRPRGAEDLVHTFTRTCDVFAEPRIKQVHALGTVARGRLEIADDSPYTGLLAPGTSPAMIRFSIANPVLGVSLPELIPDLEFIPGIGIKLFVDGRPSENILAMDSLAGQGDNHNFFLHDFSNNFTPRRPHTDDPATAERYGRNAINREVMAHVGTRFAEALALAGDTDDGAPFHRPIGRLARVRLDGSEVPEPRAPDWLVFRAADDVEAKPSVTDPDPGIDFRAKLSGLEPGDRVFRVYAADRGEEVHIGYVELDSRPRASRWSDRELFIAHPM